MARPRRPRSPRRRNPSPLSRAVSAAALLAAAPGLAAAGPTGGEVVTGDAQISTSGDTTEILQSTDRAAINWSSFDIDPDETVQFLQPTVDSITLNRVLSDLPSDIRGQLTANGRVWIVNPRGIVFGKSAQIDVGGLLATTAQIADDDFAAGRDIFREVTGGDAETARIVNDGVIMAGPGGVVIVAPIVENTGVIETRGSDLMLAAAGGFTVDMEGDGLLSFEVAAESDAARTLANTGALRAVGGDVRLTQVGANAVAGGVMSVGGLVEATRVEERGGEIVLAGGGLVDVTGTLTASGGAGETGGDVTIDGERIALRDGSRIDVSGETGGGTVSVGGRDGPAPAKRLLVEDGAVVDASATVDGDGGDVAFWSDEATIFHGDVFARGAGFGDGGAVDISGGDGLTFDGYVDLSAPFGSPGALTFDPGTITIETPGSENSEVADNEVLFGDGGGGFTISPAALEAVVGDVVLQATSEIFVNESFTLDGAVFLQSGDYLEVGADITAAAIFIQGGTNVYIGDDGAPVTLTATAADGQNTGVFIDAGLSIPALLETDPLTASLVMYGSIDSAADVTLASNSELTVTGDITAAGDLNMFAGANVQFFGPGEFTNGDISAQNVTMTGDADFGALAPSDGSGGVFVGANMTVTGDATFTGASEYGDLFGVDMLINGSITAGDEVTATSTGDLVVNADIDPPFVTLTGDAITLTGMIDAGLLTLNAETGVSQTDGAVTADRVEATVEDVESTPGYLYMDQPGNDFGTFTILAASDVDIVDANDIIVEGAVSPGYDEFPAFNVESLGGDVTLGGDGDGSTDFLSVDIYANVTASGSILQGAGAVTFADNVNFDAGGDIKLDNPANDFDAAYITANAGGDLTIWGAGDLTFYEVTGGGDVTLRTGGQGEGTLDLIGEGSYSAGGTFAIVDGDGGGVGLGDAVVDGFQLDAFEASLIDAPAVLIQTDGDILESGASPVDFTGSMLTLESTGDGAITVAGALSADAIDVIGGSSTVSGTVSAAGAANFELSGGMSLSGLIASDTLHILTGTGGAGAFSILTGGKIDVTDTVLLEDGSGNGIRLGDPDASGYSLSQAEIDAIDPAALIIRTEGDITVADLVINGENIGQLILQAGGTVYVVGDLTSVAGARADLIFGDEAVDGYRPQSVMITGRLLSWGDIYFFVLGDVRIGSPEFVAGGADAFFSTDTARSGQTILSNDGLFLIDVGGAFLQQNTGVYPTEGEGGAGAEIGFLNVVNAERVALFGTRTTAPGAAPVGGAAAAAGPIAAPDQPFFGAYRFNNCIFNAPELCLLPDPTFPTGITDSGDLTTSILQDLEPRFGLLTQLTFFAPELEEEEPVTNRGDEEIWE